MTEESQISTAGSAGPRIAWVTRSFLDYRIPVFAALDRLTAGKLQVIFAADYVPDRVQLKLRAVLGSRAIGLRGEWKIGREDRLSMANANLSLRFHPGLLKQIDACRPDVLIADGFFKWTFGALLHKLRRGVPLVVCYERTRHTERNVQWFRTLYRRMVIRQIDAMCCNGRLCSEYTQSLGMPADRITLGHMAADLSGVNRPLDAAERERLRQNLNVCGTCFLYVGKLEPRKGVRELLQGWNLFRQRRSGEATLLLVGEGEQRAELQHMAEKMRLSDVRFVGAVDYDRLAPYYAVADAFVIATLEDNWSLVVPEAMACGLPILCSKYNGCWPELVQPANGWVFDPLSPEDTGRVLEACLQSAGGLREMGEASRAIVANHTPERAAQAIWSACAIALRHNGSNRMETGAAQQREVCT